MVFVAPFRPLWWVARRMLRLLTCATLAGTLWAGQHSAATVEPPQFTYTSVTSARVVAQAAAPQAQAPAAPVASVPAKSESAPATSEAAPRGQSHGEPGQDRAPPRA